MFNHRRREYWFPDGRGYMTFVALIVGGIIAAAVVPWLLLAPPMIDVQGQVGLLPGDYVAHGATRRSGQGWYADMRAKGKLYITADGWTDRWTIGEGHLLPSGRCEFPFVAGTPPGHPTYVFLLGDVARWSFTEAELSRPLELTVDRLSIV